MGTFQIKTFSVCQFDTMLIVILYNDWASFFIGHKHATREAEVPAKLDFLILKI